MDFSQALSGEAPLPSGRFEGRSDFGGGVRAALACAAREGWQELVLCDFDFHDWPLGDRDVEASLHAWAARGRRMTLLAAHYDEVVRRHARFVRWRATWDHIVECRKAPVKERQELLGVLWSGRWVLQRLDPERCTGVAGGEPERRVQVRQVLDEWLRRSTPAFPATTLGL
ncbi:hypothetical protein C8246_08275 [Paracidovorax avenae]|uniref:hypothetical protein n=1 Tax=Paracidovorax avenae TaxID=80867 RepID=UPI000D174A6D|nr:hypothetical protein [Paracidovorax avenae]AVS77380.1 hypothetical protein C8234_04345 [Paracidovorax avenae]AVS91776.1 hypothetical protein C8246_08275 [Paracidovorax avenae]AVS98451.1 hypothetical protein C8236_06090 [Paracidovorax avenae]AVT05497.1 hypothetical protein C8248_05495 [Paracidovorax avenae]AVT19695.1 hypothetical protein C7Y68_06405 [Paracidovorax avenae]